jgi:hypothetical protein
MKKVSSTNKILEIGQDNCDIEEDTGEMSTGVEIVVQMSHNTLTRAEEYI